MAKPTKSSTSVPKIETNPFFIAVDGISRFLNLASGLFVLFLVWAVFTSFSGSSMYGTTKNSVDELNSTISTWTSSDALVALGAVAIVGLAIAMVSALFGGVSAYTSAQLAKGRPVTIGQAFSVAFDNLWSFLWLKVIISVRVFLWTLLLVVPGIIASIRYSLAPVAFYDDSKNLRGTAAINESVKLTKNRLMTVFGANVVFNVITLGALTNLITVGVNAILYRDLSLVIGKKVQTHWLSRFAAIFIVFVALFVALGILAAIFTHIFVANMR